MITPAPPRPLLSPLVFALRSGVHRAPEYAAAHIAVILDDPRTTDPVLRTDLQVLLAEALLQAGELPAAQDAAAMAAQTAGVLNPPDWPRLATALLVGGDLAVIAGHPSAVTACVSARHALTAPAPADPERDVVAAAMHAVAAYRQTGGQYGRRTLAMLRVHAVPGGLAARMLTSGLSALGGEPTDLSPGAWHRIPLPGGLLHPHLDEQTVGWLADRITTVPSGRPPVAGWIM